MESELISKHPDTLVVKMTFQEDFLREDKYKLK